ncbi:DUF6544 family protein [Sphaerobacter thermophilus]|uniref:DUF6544 family protein n=1 Tax=Sphaerobacter thermophilus TaxID=2057 RepID=UPI002355E74E
MKTLLRWITGAVVVGLAVGSASVTLGQRGMTRMVRRDVTALLTRAEPVPAGVVTDTMLSDLPEPVRRYLAYSGIVGKPMAGTVHLKQTGRMRLSPGQPWMPLTAQQYFSVRPPGFVWDGTVRLGPLPVARGRDMYLDGVGHMLIKAGGVVTVADAGGPEMDQGALMRYLSELIWLPTGFLGEQIAFESLDAQSVRVTLTDHGQRVSGTMHFDDEGRFTRFVAQRYRSVDGGQELTAWSAEALEYGERGGLMLPVRARASWMLPDGDFSYIDLTVTEAVYDPIQP